MMAHHRLSIFMERDRDEIEPDPDCAAREAPREPRKGAKFPRIDAPLRPLTTPRRRLDLDKHQRAARSSAEQIRLKAPAPKIPRDDAVAAPLEPLRGDALAAPADPRGDIAAGGVIFLCCATSAAQCALRRTMNRERQHALHDPHERWRRLAPR